MFLIEPISRLLLSLQAQMRENQKNYFLGRVAQIVGDAPSTEDGAWGNHSMFRRGHLKGEIDYENMREIVHGPLIDTFLELPEKV